MFAVIETGGKQYKVNEGDVIFIEKLDVADGETVTFDKVLAISGEDFKAGTPYVEGATVTATAVKTGKGKKIYVTRRIRGRASVEAETFGSQPVAGKSSCASTVLPDIHAPDPRKSKGVLPQERELVPRLPIPFLAQCAESVENLLLAGRCISGDFASHASYRMTGTAVTLGEVAGLAAAWSVKNAQRPWQWQDVPYLNREDQ